jgi:hypothetical protein
MVLLVAGCVFILLLETSCGHTRGFRQVLNSASSFEQALSFPNDNNGQCISIYMRRGDKSQEMKLVPFSRYIEAVEIVMERFLNTSEPRAPGTKGKPAIFIGTESNEALLETIAWGEKNDYQVSYVLINGNTQHDIKTIPDV